MIHSLRLKNFRAYKDQTFDFAKLNIFVGANNTGKSSALSAINFIAQSIIQSDVNAGPVAINGAFEQLGTFLDVVHGNKPTTPIGFTLEYGHAHTKNRISFEIKYRTQRKETEISAFSFRQGKKNIYSFKGDSDSHVVRVKGTSNNDDFVVGDPAAVA